MDLPAGRRTPASGQLVLILRRPEGVDSGSDAPLAAQQPGLEPNREPVVHHHGPGLRSGDQEHPLAQATSDEVVTGPRSSDSESAD